MPNPGSCTTWFFPSHDISCCAEKSPSKDQPPLPKEEQDPARGRPLQTAKKFRASCNNYFGVLLGKLSVSHWGTGI